MTNIFKKLYSSFKERPLIIIDEAIALIAAMVGSAYLAISSPNTNFILVYSLYFINAITALISAVYRGGNSIILMNCFYLILDIVGLFRAIR